ncbi:hypothetical protein CIB48_g3226 [Xylaria polymorpha]|nr:hypothetical protein CIB48_g3226 [Xylaria polymorpha]
MDGSYVPPFRRHQAAGDSSDARPAEDTPNKLSHQSARHNGNRQRYRRCGRGGRGGYQRDFFEKQRFQANPSDLYYPRDIHNYFWGSVDDTREVHSSTFHDSKDRPEKLSHLLLFFGANPRWAKDHIIFAKSKLALLPDYAVKKAENGEWEAENTHKNAGAAAKELEDGASNVRDATVVHIEPGSETVTQADGSTSTEAKGLASSPTNKQNNLTDEPSGGKDRVASIFPADSAKEDDTSQARQEITQDIDQGPAQDSTTGAQELKPSGNDKVLQFISGDNINYEKQEAEHASADRLKYTDIRKEEAEASLEPNQSAASERNAKYTDIRTTPATQFYHEPSPVFPAIAPIDYVPTNPLPIAIFEEQRIPGLRTGGTYARFAFKGWFKISRINILAPHSAELVRMLQQKWERKDHLGKVLPTRPRDTSAWNASLAVEWAVVAFQLWEGEGAPPPPQIEKLPEPERPVVKSVNEMLSNMRLNDGSGDGPKGDHHATVKLDEDGVNPEPSLGENPPAPDK